MKKEEILKILIDWNYWGQYVDTSLERPEYLSILRRFAGTGEITVIKGVRRSGKSTVISQFARKLMDGHVPAKNILIVNFEDPRFISVTLESLNRIYEVYLEELLPDPEHYVVLDEVQEIEGWEKFARFLSEARKVHVFITGSSSKLLSEEYSTLLSGRHIDLEIFPLSFREFLSFKGIEVGSDLERIKERHRIRNCLKEYLEFGSFPKVALVRDSEKRFILESYFRDILIKDVQRRFRIRETVKMEEMAKYYLTNISTIQSFNRMKNLVKLSLDSVERFSDYFNTARLFFFVPKFSYSLKEQVLNPKKVYGIDVGLRNCMSFRFSGDIGRLIENIVFMELKRRGHEIFYWRSGAQREVDFVIKDGQKITRLVQVCFDLEEAAVRQREVTSLLEGSKKLKCDNLLIINDDYEEKEKVGEKTIQFVPLWKWLMQQP